MKIKDVSNVWCSNDRPGDNTLLVLVVCELENDPKTYTAFVLFHRESGNLRLPICFRESSGSDGARMDTFKNVGTPGKANWVPYTKENVPMPRAVVSEVESVARKFAGSGVAKLISQKAAAPSI